MRSPGRAAGVGLDEKVAFLRRPGSYPHRPECVQAIETHMAWVFLAGSEAYKLKKPVRWDFLDFSTLDARRRDCEEEVRLNRRLASDVYQGVAALWAGPDGRLSLIEEPSHGTGGDGEVADWLVHMRRLPDERMLDVLIRARRVPPEAAERLARVLVPFYAAAAPEAMTADRYRRRFRLDVLESRRRLGAEAGGMLAERAHGLADRLLRALSEHVPLLDARVEEGRIVEGHGDLRAEHVCLLDEPVIIDCLEFRRDFRVLDPADELAFLHVECARLGDPDLGEAVLDAYASLSGDRLPPALLGFYRSFRALQRARIAIWHLRDDAIRDHDRWIRRAEAYVDLAEAFSREPC